MDAATLYTYFKIVIFTAKRACKPSTSLEENILEFFITRLFNTLPSLARESSALATKMVFPD